MCLNASLDTFSAYFQSHRDAYRISGTWLTMFDDGLLLQAAKHPLQDSALQQVMSIVGCNKSAARTLLIHFRWNVDTLCGRSNKHHLLY